MVNLHFRSAIAQVGDLIDPESSNAELQLGGDYLFYSQKNLLGGPAPVRRFLPHLIDLVLTRKINPGKVFDLELPIADVAEGYRAMDERRAIKTLLRV